MLLNERNILYPEVEEKIVQLEEEGKTVILIAIDNVVGGIIAIADTLKERTKDAIEEFKEMKFYVVMITGDNARTANAVAEQIGIKNVLAEVLPQDKANEVKKLQERGAVVAFPNHDARCGSLRLACATSPPMDRLSVAAAGELSARHRRSEIDLQCVFGKPRIAMR